MTDAVPPQHMGEEEAIAICEKHFDGFTKLLAIPLPLVVAVMVALATTNEPIEILGAKYPRGAAEMIARSIVALILAQCCVHLTVISSISGTFYGSLKLKRAIAWHPGLCNPFFTPPRASLGVSGEADFLQNLLLGRWLSTQIAVGFSIGFAEGFRIDYSPAMLSHWYRLGAGTLYLFDRTKSNEWFAHAHDYGSRYVAKASSGMWGFDTVLTLLHLFMVAGIAIAIVCVISYVCASKGAFRRMIACLSLSFFAGLVAAFVASASL